MKEIITYFITINCPNLGNRKITIKVESESEAIVELIKLFHDCEIPQIKQLLLD